MRLPPPSFLHLRRLTDDVGLFEHADHIEPRRDGGYCVDDVARALVVVCREPRPTTDPHLAGLAELYLAFLLEAQGPDGRFRNRLGLDGQWQDAPTVEDCWGRALWGLGAAVASGLPAKQRDRAREAFWRGAAWRSPYSRSMAFAALGAAEMLRARPDDAIARKLLDDAAERIGRPRSPGPWLWPEGRLRYANAALPEVLIAAGAALDDPRHLADGLTLLEWLFAVESRDGHVSVTPVAGRGPGELSAGFDQQPIEVAALADAFARAFAVTGEPRWARAVELAAGWFLGVNDSRLVMYDVATGGGCDGLERASRNENQGAESTLAALSTMQVAQRLQVFAR
ncbi:MAG: hypothetical protein QOG52_1302 [Frankiaceae bacterium]|nr:hypothetical protein [Frankiaceae bacterium]